jgi:preprotein translocase subunit SecE
MAKTGPVEFAREVRQEVAKVTWPTRRETLVTTAIVFLMVVAAALFFFLADQILGFVVRSILNFRFGA